MKIQKLFCSRPDLREKCAKKCLDCEFLKVETKTATNEEETNAIMDLWRKLK